MHSFHQSRGRTVFEALCALTISASCVGAWLQTGATALLAAAAAAALFGIVHVFGMAGRKPASAGDFPTVDEARENAREEATVAAKPAAAEPHTVEAVASVEAADVQPKPRRAKAPRKSRSRAAKKKPEAEVAEIKPALKAVPDFVPEADETPMPIAPLFEPEPFVRQQRTVFGRKAG